MNWSLSCLSALVPNVANVSTAPLNLGPVALWLLRAFLEFLPVERVPLSLALVDWLGAWLLGAASGVGLLLWSDDILLIYLS